MIALIQRVNDASVTINGYTTASIERGVLALIGIEKGDTLQSAQRLLEKILKYRIFPDGTGRMNLDLFQAGGELLLVPQFTLVADTRKGNRPGFSRGATPEDGKALFEQLLVLAKKAHAGVCAGTFGADMQVKLTNDGPVTFWLQVKADNHSQ